MDDTTTTHSTDLVMWRARKVFLFIIALSALSIGTSLKVLLENGYQNSAIVLAVIATILVGVTLAVHVRYFQAVKARLTSRS